MPLVAPAVLVIAVLLAAACDTSMSASPGTSSSTAPAPTSRDGGPSTDPDGVRPDSTDSTDSTGPGQPGGTLGIVTGGTAVSHSPGPRPNDIRDIEFADFTFPRTACGSVIDRPPPGGYQLVDGEARSPNPTADDSYVVSLSPTVSYGDVDSDGVRDAALILECDHGSRPIPVGWIYSIAGGRPVPLARVDLDPDALGLRAVLDTELAAIRFEGSTLVTDWVIYLDGDALCCPTRSALVAWTWVDGALTPAAPQVTRTLSGG